MTPRRSLTILCLLLLTVFGSGRGLAADEEPEPTSAGTTDLLVDEDRAAALVVRDKDRVRQLGRLAEDAPPGLPFRRVDGATGYASVILPERAAPYTIPEIAVRFPEAIQVVEDGVYLVQDDLIVGIGAELRIASDHVRALRLLSVPERFVTITSWRGSITVAGQAWQRIAITAWDPVAAAPDTNLADGRSWIHTRRGSMSIAWADLEYLGFATGSLSGVAWEGRHEDPSGGDVTGSGFRFNYFGAYTFESVDMHWRLNTFADNLGYGFDPHDRSDRFVVEFNRAYRNGTHGIIFSRHCSFNVIRYNQSFDNGMHGIVLDDGPNFDADGNLRERQGIPSDDNIVIGNLVTGNEVGIVLDGGERNFIASNIVSGNRYGLRMKDAVQGNIVRDNRLVNNSQSGIYLYNHSNDNFVTGNTVIGGVSGVVVKDSTGNTVDGNTLSGSSKHGLSFSGDIGGTSITNNVVTGAPTGISLSRVIDPNVVAVEGNKVEGDNRSTTGVPIWDPLGRWGFWAAILIFPVLLGPWYTKIIGGLRQLLPKRASSAA